MTEINSSPLPPGSVLPHMQSEAEPWNQYKRLQASLPSGWEFEPSEVQSAQKFLEHANFSPPEIVPGDTLNEMTEIILDGTLNGRPVDTPEVQRNTFDKLQERMWLAALASRDKETAHKIIEKEIAGFHVAPSPALAGLIEDGALMSGSELRVRGKGVATGQHDGGLPGKGQPSISFGALQSTAHNVEAFGGATRVRSDEEVIAELEKSIQQATEDAMKEPVGSHWHNKLRDTAARHNDVLETFRRTKDGQSAFATLMRIKFPVAFGISADFVRQGEEERQSGGLKIGQRDYSEFRPAQTVIPSDALPVIAVPQDKVKPVSDLLAMFGHEHTSVVPLESVMIQRPFYTAFEPPTRR